jgi:uncharacterized membrane protein
MSPSEPGMTGPDATSPLAAGGRWVPVTALVLTVAGLAVSIYLTVAHFASPAVLICSSNGAINCEKVTTSAESYVLGIPVAILGVVFFAAMVALNTPAAWRSGTTTLTWGRFGFAAVGLLFVVYLVSAELVVLHAICLWCTAVHVLTGALFLVTTVGMIRATRPDGAGS